MAGSKNIYGSLHCLAAVINGRHVETPIAHPCSVTGKNTFSVLFYYFEKANGNLIQLFFNNKSVKRCVKLPKGDQMYGWHIEDPLTNSNLLLVLSDDDGLIAKYLLRGLPSKYESHYQEDLSYFRKALMPLDISSLRDCPIQLVTEIRFYLLFMKQHNYPNRKEFRKLMKSSQTFKPISVPVVSTAKESGFMCSLFIYFWSQHKCKFPGCNKFSYMKCGNCKQFYYCSKICQEKDWKSHKQTCEKDRSYAYLENYIRMEFQGLLKHNVKSDIIDIKSAMKKIKFRIFQLNARNSKALYFMKSPTSIESIFTEKTYLELLEKPPKETKPRS